MTEQEKLDMNMAAARLIGGYIDTTTGFDELGVKIGNCKKYGEMHVRFDIFTNASQCLQAVKKLGEEINVYLYPVEGKGWRAIDYCGNPLTNIFDTYEQAVGAACLKEIKWQLYY